MNGAAALIWPYLSSAFWSGLAAVGFALLFNAPRRALPGCALAGALGYVSRLFLIQRGLSEELATLAGATAIGFLAEWLARRRRTPASVFSIPGAIPLVPGRLAFGTMVAILELSSATGASVDPFLAEAVVSGIKTALVLAAIATGIGVPRLLFRRQPPVV